MKRQQATFGPWVIVSCPLGQGKPYRTYSIGLEHLCVFKSKHGILTEKQIKNIRNKILNKNTNNRK